MFLKLLFISTLIFLCHGVSYACMCGSSSISEAFNNADAIVAATVKSYRAGKVPFTFESDKGEKKTIIEDGQEVFLGVSKWIKGTGGNDIVLAQPNSSCDWTFDDDDLDKVVLLYLVKNRVNERYFITSCGRSSTYEKAAMDLVWLNALPKSLNRTLIIGQTNLNDKSSTFPSVPNVTITVVGKSKSYFVKTDSNGVYELWDVPPGKYRISAKPPENMILSWTVRTPESWTYFWTFGDSDLISLDVTISSKETGGVNFMFKEAK